MVSDHKYNYSLPWKQIALDRGESLPRIYRAAELWEAPQGMEAVGRGTRTQGILNCWPGSTRPCLTCPQDAETICKGMGIESSLSLKLVLLHFCSLPHFIHTASECKCQKMVKKDTK